MTSKQEIHDTVLRKQQKAGQVASNDGSDKFAMMHMASPCEHQRLSPGTNIPLLHLGRKETTE
jgi:hypothetical protein